MQVIWQSSNKNTKFYIVSIVTGIILLLFSPFIIAMIGIFFSAVVLIISLTLLGSGLLLRGSSFTIPLIIIGLVGCFFSMYALLFPHVIVSFIGISMGIFVLVIGIVHLFFSSGFRDDSVSWFFLIFGGITSMIVGLYLIFFPLEGMQLVMIFIGFYLISYGIIGTIRMRRSYSQPDLY